MLLSERARRLLAEVLTLPASERADLAAELLASLPDDSATRWETTQVELLAELIATGD